MIILLSSFVLCCYLISVSAPVCSTHNLPSFRASSQILASLSSYQYTRKAWRREALEMLLDAMFFQMDEACIGYWKAVIDNLMTHDKTTFKDLLGKTSHFQCGTIITWSILSEIPMRKKLATVTAHRELTVSSRWPKWSQPAVTWAVIELWPCRDWAVITVIELWLSHDWAVT